MQPHAIVTTMPLPESARRNQTERVAREWLSAFASFYGVTLREKGDRFRELWIAAVSDLAADELQHACEAAIRVCKFFPTAAEVREQIQRTKTATAAIDDELAWQEVLDHCTRYVWRDAGKTGPLLSNAVEFAVRRAGGWFYLEECSRRDLGFAKQRFIAALADFRSGLENFPELPDGPSRHLISAVADKKCLPDSDNRDLVRVLATSDDRVTGEYFEEARRHPVLAQVLAEPYAKTLWRSAAERTRAYKSLDERETNSELLAKIRAQCAELEARGFTTKKSAT